MKYEESDTDRGYRIMWDKRDDVKNLPISIKDKMRKYAIFRKINNFLKKI